MKFAHIADVHIGGWRDPKLKEISSRAFDKAIDVCIEKQVDFVIIAGDLFNTSLPSIEGLRDVVIKLKDLKDKNIPCYTIPGSHDFSPSGKTMLDVLESAGLTISVAKRDPNVTDKIKLLFTVDEKTGTKITGMIGKRGGLEKNYYELLERESIESEPGYKIFMFHSLLTELKPPYLEMSDSQPLSLLPKNFNYYAGGHPHFVENKQIEGYGTITYPGPIFPNNFRELELLKHGGFYIVEDNNPIWQPIELYKTISFDIKADRKTPEQVRETIMDELKDKDFQDTIVTIRVSGLLESGKTTDVDFQSLFQYIQDKSAFFIMKNTSALKTKDFQDIQVQTDSSELVEKKIIEEHLGKIKVEGMDLDSEKRVTNELMKILSTERGDEKVADFEKRVTDEILALMNLNT